MASSDDEFEELPEFVSDYYFVDEDDEPISFSVLPFQWSLDEVVDGKRKQIFVHGTTDGGLQKIYKPVKAWKINLSRMNPEISVLSKENNWIKLQKPKKSFECMVRTTLITVNCLHIMKKNPETSEKSLWDQLSKIFSLLEPRPSVNDLIDHMELVKEAFRRDQSLCRSKFIATFLEEKPHKKRVLNEDESKQTMRSFIIDDDGVLDDNSDEDELNDDVCAICDNGGLITYCDGICMRQFHTNPEDAQKDAEEEEIEEYAICSSLGYSKKQIEDMPKFICKNCLHKQHQCFSCGQLGSSDKTSGVAEVFQCVSATCGYFYHPRCVAKLLHPDDPAAAEELEKNISAGVPFACPIHNCYVCKQVENPTVHELQFAVCRRCPMSYHRKCLPREISFRDTEDFEQRAWENLLSINNRILIYCLKHKIDPDLGTPTRNHLKFPGDESEKHKQSSELLLRKSKLAVENKSLVPEMKRPKKVVPNISIGSSSHAVREGQSSGKNFQRTLARKRKTDRTDASSKRETEQISKKIKKKASSSIGEKRGSFGERLWEKYSKQSDSTNQSKFVSEDESRKSKTVSRQSDSLVDKLDPASKERIENLIKEAESSITSDSTYEKYNKLLSTHAHSQKTLLDSFTQGKVETLVQAIQTALRKLDDGCDIEEAKAVCGPNILNQIVRWKNRLRVYIAPFLHGMRYTSFGRHFTKVDKLKEIVDEIHWYVEDGDTVVDFCCGANDFSCLMKDKLEETGKKCFYRNFDLFRPKNDFCFERRDWMTVRPSELPRGSNLVMGLNPPFGVKASLANRFIDKALEFKPKLIVLIVPPETERLDKKKPPYDLIFEDCEKLSGRSFYLPGSVDVNDKQMDDWNVTAPVFYLWSRHDWALKFREIAKRHGHLGGKGSLERHSAREVPSQSIEVNVQSSSGMEIDVAPTQEVKPGEVGAEIKDCVVELSLDGIKEESHATNGNGSSESRKRSRKKRRCGKYRGTGKDETALVGNDHNGHGRSSAEPYHRRVHHSLADDVVLNRSSLDDQLLANERPLLARESAELDVGQFEGRSGLQYRPGYPTGDTVDEMFLAGNDHNGRGRSSAEPYHRRVRYSPADDGMLNRRALDDQLLANERSHIARESAELSVGQVEGRPGFQYGPRLPTSSSSYLEDFPRRFGIENDNPHLSGLYGLSSNGRHPLDGIPSYMIEGEGLGHQAYNSEMELRYRVPPPSFRSDPPRGPLGMSAMEGYAPMLDELNRVREGSLGLPDLPSRHGYGRTYSYQVYEGTSMGFAPGPYGPNEGVPMGFGPGPGPHEGASMGFGPGPHEGASMGFGPAPHQGAAMGFAPGSQRSASHRSPGGWINE